MKKIVLIISIIALTAIITSAALILWPKNTAKASEPSPTPETSQDVKFSYAIEDAFITNVKDSERFAKTSIVLVVDSEEAMTALGEKVYEVKSVVIQILRDTTEDEFLRSDCQSVLGQEILNALKQDLQVDWLQEVYFTEFVIQ